MKEESARSMKTTRRPQVRSRLTAAALAAVLGPTALVASPSVSSASTLSASTKGPLGPGKTLTYLYFTNGPDLTATKALIAKFDKQTGDKVSLQVVPFANLNEEVQARISAGDPPDVLQTNAPQIIGSDLVNLGAALGSSWVKSLSPSLIVGGEYDGEVVGLPNQLTVMGPFVNVTMFKKAGVPVPGVTSRWTWPQMIADVEKVQRVNHTPFGFSTDLAGDRIANVLAAYGTFIYGANGHGTMNTADATKALTMYTGLLEHNEISKDAWIAGGENYVDGASEFLAGEAPVLLSGSWQVAGFAAQKMPFQWTAVPNPCMVYCGGGPGGNYMVAFKKSSDPALAEEFIKFMSEPVNQAYMSVVSATIPSAIALEKPGAVAYKPDIRSIMNVFNQAAALMPGAFLASESNTGYTQTTLTLLNEVTKVITGKATVAQAVAATQAAAR